MTYPVKSTFNLPSSIAVIGAGGFLGANLTQHLAPNVRDLRCFGRRQSFPQVLRDFRWYTGDISDTNNSSLGETIAGCDAVIHLASTSTPTTADRDVSADAQANVIGTLSLLDRCVEAGVKQVIFISSGGTVYGIPEVTPTPESAPTYPITAYGVAKLAIEKYLDIYYRQHGLEYRVLRIANAYGPFQTSEKQQGVVAAFLAKTLRGEALEIWGDGQVVRDYVFASDVVQSVVAAIEYQGQQRIFNIGSGTGHSLLEVVAAIESTLGRKLKVTFKAGRPVDVPVSVLDCSLARKELSWWARTEFSEGLRRTADWMKNWS